VCVCACIRVTSQLIFWDFGTHKALREVHAGAGVTQLALVRDTGLLAAACSDAVVRVFDFATRYAAAGA
jgi:hypothetical protein